MTSVSTPRVDVLAPVHDMSMDELRREYISLKSTGYSLSVEESHLVNKIEVLREEAVRAELNAEVREEQMSNQLFRRLDGAEREVQRCKALLKEEESEAEALAARIKTMRNEKNEVENVLEERQEFLLMNLQRKLLETARKKTEVEQELMLERQRYLDLLVTRLDALRRRSATPSAESVATPAPAADPSASVLSQSGSVVAGGVERQVDAAAAAAPAATVSSEKTAADEAPSAPPLKSPFSSFSRPPALPGTPHGLALTPGVRPAVLGTPRSGDLTPLSSHSSETHHAVVNLERKLNQLLLEQAAAMQRTSATEKQCAELGAKLRSVQEATFLDRARASKLKEELKEARARLAEANNASAAAPGNVSLVADGSFDDSMTSALSTRSFDPTMPMPLNNLSLRERTRELLSSIPPPPSV